jgi:hypothetical protein
MTDARSSCDTRSSSPLVPNNASAWTRFHLRSGSQDKGSHDKKRLGGTFASAPSLARMFMFDVETIAEESFTIAWDYLERAGSIGDPDAALVELGDEIIALLGKGEHHKIRIANLAIDAYRRRHMADA